MAVAHTTNAFYINVQIAFDPLFSAYKCSVIETSLFNATILDCALPLKNPRHIAVQLVLLRSDELHESWGAILRVLFQDLWVP